MFFQGFKFSPKVTENEDIELVVEAPSGGLQENQRLLLSVAKQRLLDVERAIERRYLKAPFCKQ